MHDRVSRSRWLAGFAPLALFVCMDAANADPLAIVNAARTRSCGAPTVLVRVSALDSAAQRLAEGAALRSAVQASGYRARNATSLSLDGVTRDDDIARAVARSCADLAQPALRDAGVFQRGNAVWIVFAEPFTVPSLDAAKTSMQVLDLVNRARAKPRRCGSQDFAAAEPLRWSPRLERAALAHARDMATRSSMSHTGSDGSTPSRRVTRAGYTWSATGENVAAGQRDADSVVKSWLSSPGHCANVMSPDYTEMAVAFATNPKSEAGIYWTQVFGAPLTTSVDLRRR